SARRSRPGRRGKAMPGNVGNAAPVNVMPFTTARRFVQTIVREVDQVAYPDGRRETATRFGSARRAWELGVRLTPAELDELRTFFAANAHKAFLFYDAAERERL